MPVYAYLCRSCGCSFEKDYAADWAPCPQRSTRECDIVPARRDWRSVNVNLSNLRAGR